MAFFKSAPILALLAAAPVEGVQMPRLRGSDTAEVSMHMYRHDCGHASGFSFAQNPGAGMTPGAIKPFVKVLKDGFMAVDCVKDYLFEHGDKFGDNKASYKLGDLTNVSIVHYAAHVPKEDRAEMTHEICFRFCRTVPEMVFFGLTNGRECYCTPYFEAEASDSSDCDAVCDGDKGTMCGGKTKSSMFAMHQCASTKADLTHALENLQEVATDLSMKTTVLGAMSGMMQKSAAAFQDAFGKAGDPGASDLMQTAKVLAGEGDELARRALAVQEASSKTQTASEELAAKGDFAASTAVTQAEELMKAMEKETADMAAVTEEMELKFAENLEVLLNPEASVNASKQYYSAMYFVDPQFEKQPSTCTGIASEKPMVATLDGCARACGNDLHECVAFLHAPPKELPQGQAEGSGLCFLFSKLKTIRYYTGCVEQDGHTAVKCYAKLSKFEGTVIKPDASGKCEGCLKEAKQADRCFV